jgi:hypothetical protein
MAHKDLGVRREYHKNYREQNKSYIKELNREYNLNRKYGISISQYNELLERQNFRCGLCAREAISFPRGYSLAVDHDHRTGEIRGLLCYTCNIFLGKIDNKDYMNRVSRYLRKPDVIEIDKYGKVCYN